MSTMLRGFDVSHWQGAEDWSSMKTTHDIGFGFVKATESTTYVDTALDENWSAIRAAGLVRGAYHFARPSESTAVAQADYFVDAVNRVGGMSGSDLPILDFETSGGLGTNAGLKWCLEWGRRVRERTDLVPMIYLGSWAVDDVVSPQTRDVFCGWWFPRYAGAWVDRAAWPADYSTMVVPAGSKMGGLPDIWQFSQSFPVGGEAHDANVSTLTLAQLQSLNRRTMNEHDAPVEENMPLPAVMVATGQTQQYLVDGNVKRKLTDAVGTYLVNTVGLLRYNNVPVAVLNLWPTLLVDTTGVGQDAAQLAQSALVGVAKQLSTISTTTADDATAGQVATVAATVADLVTQLRNAPAPVVDIDETAIVAGLTPILQQLTVMSAGTLTQIGEAVAAELSARMTN